MFLIRRIYNYFGVYNMKNTRVQFAKQESLEKLRREISKSEEKRKTKNTLKSLFDGNIKDETKSQFRASIILHTNPPSVEEKDNERKEFARKHYNHIAINNNNSVNEIHNISHRPDSTQSSYDRVEKLIKKNDGTSEIVLSQIIETTEVKRFKISEPVINYIFQLKKFGVDNDVIPDAVYEQFKIKLNITQLNNILYSGKYNFAKKNKYSTNTIQIRTAKDLEGYPGLKKLIIDKIIESGTAPDNSCQPNNFLDNNNNQILVTSRALESITKTNRQEIDVRIESNYAKTNRKTLVSLARQLNKAMKEMLLEHKKTIDKLIINKDEPELNHNFESLIKLFNENFPAYQITNKLIKLFFINRLRQPAKI